jgi:hypothetical protein
MNISDFKQKLENHDPELDKDRLINALKVIERLAIYSEDDSCIYEIAHIARKPVCKDTHEKWEAKFQKLKREFGYTE